MFGDFQGIIGLLIGDYKGVVFPTVEGKIFYSLILSSGYICIYVYIYWDSPN